jgi:sulfite exporter TauE/SafE
MYLLGGLNGLLPCGLVYVACAGALATGGLLSGWLFMICFGLGTVPLMLALALPGRALQAALAQKFRRVIPVTLAIVAVLLIVRGLGLGIPYLSPALSAGTSCCH